MNSYYDYTEFRQHQQQQQHDNNASAAISSSMDSSSLSSSSFSTESNATYNNSNETTNEHIAYLMSLGSFLLMYFLIICMMTVIRIFVGRQMMNSPRFADDIPIEDDHSQRRRRNNNNNNNETSREILKRARKEYIRKTLVSKHVIQKTEMDMKTNDSSDDPDHSQRSKKWTYMRKKSNLILLPTDDNPSDTNSSSNHDLNEMDNENENNDDTKACSICLIEYQNGDEICWSRNPDCNHVFHQKCMETWLLYHDLCPCCRAKYLWCCAIHNNPHASKTNIHHHHHHHQNEPQVQQHETTNNQSGEQSTSNDHYHHSEHHHQQQHADTEEDLNSRRRPNGIHHVIDVDDGIDIEIDNDNTISQSETMLNLELPLGSTDYAHGHEESQSQRRQEQQHQEQQNNVTEPNSTISSGPLESSSLTWLPECDEILSV